MEGCVKKLALCMFLALPASAAHAAVIDFEALAHNGSGFNYVGNSYVESGFQFTKGQGEPFDFGVMGSGEGRYTGSAALFNDTIGGTTTLSRVGGGVFTLSSIDVSELNYAASVFVNFVGELLGGGQVFATIQTDGTFGMESFLFNSAWTNLVSVSWTQDSPFHQFDNVNVEPGSVSPVPVPAGGLLLVGALAGLAALRRKARA